MRVGNVAFRVVRVGRARAAAVFGLVGIGNDTSAPFLFLLLLIDIALMEQSNQNGASSAGTSSAQAAVFVQSEPVPESALKVQGPNFDKPLDLTDLLASYERVGFQATSVARAIEIVNKMVSAVSLFFKGVLGK